jgi:hypothetical protein
MKGKLHPGFGPALRRERELQRRHESVHNTTMRAAFLKALYVWAARHADDDTGNIVIPTGVVTTADLAQVITALIASKQERGRGYEPAAK